MVITICELAVMAAPGEGGSGGVVQVGTSASGTTVQLTTTLSGTQANVYAVAGTVDGDLTLPPAFQVAAPFGTHIGGVNPAFFAAMPTSEYDSWLTVGPTDGTAGSAISSIGVDLDSWSDTVGVSSNNGAVFWMNPSDGPSGTVTIAQITNAGSGTASAILQGRSTAGEDYQSAVTWSW